MLNKINSGEPFEVTVKEAVKGGLMAELDGIHVFIPASQIRVKGYVKDLTKFVGDTFKVTALEVDVKKRRVVASRARLFWPKSRLKRRRSSGATFMKAMW